ncbi:hypothetical protein PIB30_003195 [Stylosanthes scabra]|uniref:C2H2-type domain-containing protein n=1 Tax=Stylosanthes scabra TaxID=79078 RepID=A0ABU6Q334_9FABA|nr:hypothetical protein [Stylosanthes scabra]
MGILKCPSSCCNNYSSSKHHEDHHQQQSHHSNSNNTLLHSESSTSSSLSSQPSLPSVPSLTTSLQLQQKQELVTAINGHSAIFSLVLHGKFLYTGSSNSEIRRCRKDTFAPDHNVLVATTNSAVKSITVFGDKLFTAHQDHKIRVWKIQEQEQEQPYKCIATLPTFNDRFWKLFSSKNYVQVRRHKKRTWVHHVDTVSAVTVSVDGTLLYSASWDRTFKIWRTSDFKCLESVNAHDDAINALVVSRAGVVYTGSADKKIRVWKKLENWKNHQLVGTLEKHKSAVNALALSGDGLVLYSGACDRSILVWEKEEDEEGGEGNMKMVVVGALRGHTKAILCLVGVADLVVSGSADNSVRVWRRGINVVNSEKRCYSCLAVLEGHRRPVKCLAVAAESANNGGVGGDDENSGGGGSSYLVYSGSLDCDIRVWRIRVPLF